MKDLLKQAADTIQRLGAAAQDCKSCARLPECNAYQAEGRFENCDYKWVHEDEAADVQPVDRWISVKERLPENDTEVMLYDTDCGIVFGWYDDEREDFVAEFISPLDAVTHWQPLPEPPTNKI